MQRILTTTLLIFVLAVSAFSQTTVVQWTFNGATAGDVPGGAIHPLPSTGTGSLQTIGGVTSTLGGGSPSDLVQPSASNFSWQTATYPAPATGDQTAGIIIAFDASLRNNLTLTFDQRLSSTANNTWIVYYTADVTAGSPAWQLAKTLTFTPAPTGTGDMWYLQRSVDLSTFTVLNDNPTAGIKIVSAFDPITGNYLASQSTKTYVTTGNSRFDLITVTGVTSVPTDNHGPTATHVTISGYPNVADTLRSGYAYADDEADAEGATTFAWLRADDINGTNVRVIGGADLQYYVMSENDYGKFIAVVVTPVAKTGTLTGTADTSVFEGPVDKSVAELLYPDPFELASGNYILNNWSSSTAGGTFPPHMTFQIFSKEPSSPDAAPNGTWGCGYSNTSKARMLGLDDKGIGFLNTSDPQSATACGNANARLGYVGSVVLALNTVGLTDIVIHFQTSVEVIGDGTPPREYHLRPQYRIEGESSWSSWPGVEFSSAGKDVGKNFSNLIATTGEISNQPLVYVRWIYYQADIGASGSRPEIRLDNILIESSAVPNRAPVVEDITVDAPDTIVGTQLTGHARIFDFEDDPFDSSMFWFRSADPSGVNGIGILSAKGSSTYTLTTDDVGLYVFFAVLPLAESGTPQETLFTSTPLGPVKPGSVTTGIADEMAHVEVYPVPTSDQVTVESPDENPVYLITLLRTTGQEIRKIPATGKSTVISLRDSGSGMYFLQLTHQNGSREVRKVIRE